MCVYNAQTTSRHAKLIIKSMTNIKLSWTNESYRVINNKNVNSDMTKYGEGKYSIDRKQYIIRGVNIGIFCTIIRW